MIGATACREEVQKKTTSESTTNLTVTLLKGGKVNRINPHRQVFVEDGALNGENR